MFLWRLRVVEKDRNGLAWIRTASFYFAICFTFSKFSLVTFLTNGFDIDIYTFQMKALE